MCRSVALLALCEIFIPGTCGSQINTFNLAAMGRPPPSLMLTQVALQARRASWGKSSGAIDGSEESPFLQVKDGHPFDLPHKKPAYTLEPGE